MITDKHKDIYNIAKENNTLMYATIELLTKCNWRCKHCYITEHDSYGLSYEKLLDIFIELRELNTFELTFTGGEMLLRDDIIDILSTARKMGFNLQLFTNVSMLNVDTINMLNKLHIDKISCTIFSLNEKIHDSITGVAGSLHSALKNILLLKNTTSIKVEIKTILLESNYMEYKEIEMFCIENNIKFLATANVFPRRNGSLEPLGMAVSEKHLAEILQDIDNIRGFKRREIDNNTPICCDSINYSLSIDCKGNVSPCNNMNLVIGNVFTEKIKEIWEGSEELRNLRNLKYKDLTFCSECKEKEYCYRCPGTVLSETGNIYDRNKLECCHARIRSNYSKRRVIN